jgi:hypothetical protein
MNERERFFFLLLLKFYFVCCSFVFHFCQVSAAMNGMNEHGRLNCFPIEKLLSSSSKRAARFTRQRTQAPAAETISLRPQSAVR